MYVSASIKLTWHGCALRSLLCLCVCVSVSVFLCAVGYIVCKTRVSSWWQRSGRFDFRGGDGVAKAVGYTSVGFGSECARYAVMDGWCAHQKIHICKCVCFPGKLCRGKKEEVLVLLLLALWQPPLFGEFRPMCVVFVWDIVNCDAHSGKVNNFITVQSAIAANTVLPMMDPNCDSFSCLYPICKTNGTIDHAWFV